jgi:hypothetical protein
MSDSLYKLTVEANTLEQLLIEADGELCPILEEWMTEIATKLANKVDAIDFVVSKFEASEENLRRKAAAYEEKARTLANAQKRIKENVKAAMIANGLDCVEGSDAKFTIAKGSPKLVVTDQTKVPARYIIHEPRVDNEKLKADLLKLEKGGKLDIEITGAEIHRTPSLRCGVSTKTKETV